MNNPNYSKSHNKIIRDKPWLKIGYVEHPFNILKKKYAKIGYNLSDKCDEYAKTSRIRISKSK